MTSTPHSTPQTQSGKVQMQVRDLRMLTKFRVGEHSYELQGLTAGFAHVQFLRIPAVKVTNTHGRVHWLYRGRKTSISPYTEVEEVLS